MTDDKEAKTIRISQEICVGWFDIRTLFTGFKVFTSTIVGSMSGRREIMAALDRVSSRSETFDYSSKKDIWIDYVADTGDGWDSTFSVAWLIGRDHLWLREDCKPSRQPIPTNQQEAESNPDPSKLIELPRGEILILGGDQVYPVASASSYQSRLIDPYQSARKWQEPGREVYAIPGNHDWYDGLTAFVGVFCQQRWHGCWKTRQRRSYFAIKLPHNWWLWGIDTALEDDLDGPQHAYFIEYASKLTSDDRVILCVPTPVWAKKPELLTTDTGVEKVGYKFDVIHDLAAGNVGRNRVALALAGDWHHYARHETTGDEPKTQYITCGGGGAFTLGTRAQPREFSLPGKRRAELKKTFPSEKESNQMLSGAWEFFRTSPGFVGVIACFHLLGVWLLHVSSSMIAVLPPPYNNEAVEPLLRLFAQTPISIPGLSSVTRTIFATLSVEPLEIVFYLLFVAAMLAFAQSGQGRDSRRFLWILPGLIHAVTQLGLAILVFWLVARAPAYVGYNPESATPLPMAALVALFAGVGIFVFNGILFGVYLLLTNMSLGMHEQEVFSCQAITDYKSFLRIHVTKEKVTIYPVGMRLSNQNWKPAPGVEMSQRMRKPPWILKRPWSTVVEDLALPDGVQRLYDPEKPLEPRLIENPIDVV